MHFLPPGVPIPNMVSTPPPPRSETNNYGSRLFVVDALTGQVREASIGLGGPRSYKVMITRAIRFPGGMVTLESSTENSNKTLRVVFWNAVLPVIPTRNLASD